MEKRWFVSSVLALVVVSSGALAQSALELPAHDLRADTAGARVGDSLQMKAIGFNRDTKAFEVKVPAEDPVEQGFVVANQPQDATPEGEFWFKVTPVRPGKLTLPSLEIVMNGQGVARTNPLEIEVASAILKDDPQPETPAGIRGPARLVFPRWVVIAAGILALGLLSALAWFAWRKLKAWRDRAAMKLPEIPKTEDEVALIALSELEAKKLVEKGEHKKHYFQLSDIIKSYLGARFEFDAPESTAREIIMHLESGGTLSGQLLDKLQSSFTLLDRVKYTDHVPEEGEGARLLVEARRLVTGTRKPKAVISAT